MSDPLPKILVVDDEPAIRDSLRLLLRDEYEVLQAENGARALAMLSDVSCAPTAILLDVMMPELGGIETLRQLRESGRSVPVIMLTATTTVKTAVAAMKLGAVDYINKPFEIEELRALIRSATSTTSPAVERSTLSAAFSDRASQHHDAPAADLGVMVGRSSPMRGLFEKLHQVSPRDATVLITGESGTGKEMVAREIHRLSSRSHGPFVAINCAAIPESLIESELFGHEKGAFTHAVERRIGHFELADGGTLFLDEIGELSLTVQVKMLRFLQEQEFYRVGSSKSVRVNVRVVVATNRSLEELIRQKRFREDLFYRINVVQITLPPLRDRFEDIQPLVEYFVRKLSPLYGNRSLQLSEGARDALVQYDWPGNVRELENVVESLLALAPTDDVGVEQLPPKIADSSARQSTFKPDVIDGGMKFTEAEQSFEREMILKALKRAHFVQTKAAALLGISRRILKYKMDKLGISEQSSSPSESVTGAPEAEESEKTAEPGPVGADKQPETGNGEGKS